MADKLKAKKAETESLLLVKPPPPPKFELKVTKVSSTGEFGLGFTQPCALFGNGKLPGKEAFIVTFVKSTGQTAKVTDEKDSNAS